MTEEGGAPVDGAVFGPAEDSDLDPLVDIDRGSPQAWTRAAFAAELEHAPPTLLVLKSKDVALGFVVIRVHLPDMDIVNLAVSPHLRGQGLGRFLVSSLLEQAALTGVRSVFLEVREGNEQARRLYRSAGFSETQRRPGFYTEPAEDAILMRLEMSPGRG